MTDKGGKSDMERVGLFSEMAYTTIGDKYGRPGDIQFNVAATKGKQLLPGGSKTRSALQHGYFNTKFDRILEAEAYSDPVKMRRQHRLKESQRNIGKAFLPSNGEKRPSGLGSHYGTLTGPVGAFSPVEKPRKPYKQSGKNFMTNPAKKGTGFGYLSVTIGTYHKYMGDTYDKGKEIASKDHESHKKSMKGGAFRLNMHPLTYFDGNPYRSDKPLPPLKKTGGKGPDVKPFKPSSPSKKPAGMKAGTFDPYPSHSNDAYGVKYKRPVHVVNKEGKTFMPSTGPKTAPISSILQQNVMRSLNAQNYRQVRSVTYG